MNLSDLKIGTKLGGSFAVVILLTIIVGGYSIVQLLSLIHI